MKKTVLALVTAAGAFAQEVPAKHEIGLTLGGLFSQSRSAANNLNLDLGSGIALQANYGYRLKNFHKTSIYAEVHGIANPLREIRSTTGSLTRDVATAYITPGVRVKFAPVSRVSPYFAVGGGYALYEQSFFQLNGQSNTAPRFTHKGAFMFGGGADFRFWKFIGLRAEIRDFYTGSPDYNNPAFRGGQHNVVAGGGIVIKIGER
jgi:opacity protein-like surface antigen